MEKYPDYLVKELWKEEIVIWQGKASNNLSLYLLAFTVLMPIMSIAYLYGYLFVNVLIIIGFAAAFLKRLERLLRFSKFIITDQRILIYHWGKLHHSIPYGEIYNVKIEKRKQVIMFRNQAVYGIKRDNTKFPKFFDLSEGDKVFQLIQNEYQTKGPFHEIYQHVEEKGKMKLPTTSLNIRKAEDRIELYGIIEGIPVQLNILGNELPVKGLSISFFVKNPMNYYFRISNIGAIETISLLTGKGDLQTGDRSFDEAFLLDSPDPDFLLDILTADLKNDLLKANKQQAATIQLGEPGKKEKHSSAEMKAFEIQQDVLDTHMTTSEDIYSPLTYVCTFAKPDGDSNYFVNKVIDSSLENTLKLAKTIQSYPS